MQLHERIGQLLAQAQRSGMTRAAIAGAIDPPLSPQTLRYMETGKHLPQPHTLVRLARALGVRVSACFEDVDLTEAQRRRYAFLRPKLEREGDDE
jgi:DNA-binding XRE family transcriptional regulator